MIDVLSAPVREVLALYAEKYPEVRFPDLDLELLEAAAQKVADAVARVAEAEAAIEPLRQQVKTAESELTQKVARALAFLKVYIEGDESEYARLDALTQAMLARRPQRRSPEAAAASNGGRGRGRKSKLAEGTALGGSSVALTASDIAEADLPSSALSDLTISAKADLPSSALTELEPAAE